MRAPTKAELAPPKIAPNVSTPEIKLSLIIASENVLLEKQRKEGKGIFEVRTHAVGFE